MHIKWRRTNIMIKFRQKVYTQWDETDRLKQMKDSDILAEKKRSNSSLNMQTLKNTALGAGAGVVAGGLKGAMSKKGTFAGGAKKGAIVGGLIAGVTTAIANSKKKQENQFYNDRLEQAQRHALRRERADWKNNITNREGYSY